VGFILAKLRFHRHRPEFNGLFEYEEYISLKGIDDPNEGCVPSFCSLLPEISPPPQLRNHLGPHEPAGPNRVVPKTHLRALPTLSEQRVPYLGARPARQGIVQYLPLHNIDAPRDAPSDRGCRRPRAAAGAVQLAAPQPAQVLL
jgi:hypothetical protein